MVLRSHDWSHLSRELENNDRLRRRQETEHFPAVYFTNKHSFLFTISHACTINFRQVMKLPQSLHSQNALQ